MIQPSETFRHRQGGGDRFSMRGVVVGARQPAVLQSGEHGPGPGGSSNRTPHRQGNCAQCARFRPFSRIVYTNYICHTIP